MAYCINKLNIDVACYGNHDFDFPPEQVEKLVKDCKFPWLLGNIKYISNGNNFGGGLDYHIIEHQGVKIGFMGLAGPDFLGRLISCYKDKLRYIDIKEYAQKMCEKLRAQNCQLIVAINHCRRPVDEALCKAVPQIDLVLGGHDHHEFIKEVNQIPILKSGSDF
jgi:5'-nucleotidase